MEQDVGTKSTMCTKQFTEEVLHQSTVVQLMLVTKLNVMLCSLHVLWFYFIPVLDFSLSEEKMVKLTLSKRECSEQIALTHLTGK